MRAIYCVVGPSGSGKTTVTEELERLYGYKAVESYTTRPARYVGETGHVFVSDEAFDGLGEMCAYTEFNGYRYGVTADIIDKSDLYVIDPAGLDFFKEKYHRDKDIVVIGLTSPTEVLRQRMKGRGDSESKITERLAHDAVAFRNFGSKCDFLVSAEGPVGPICEYIHEVILYTERSKEPVEGTERHLTEDEVRMAYVERLRRLYPEGTRIVAEKMADPWALVGPGTRGTVVFVHDNGLVFVRWDNGTGLALVPQEDKFRKLTAAELAEEVDGLLACATERSEKTLSSGAAAEREIYP